jgi:hypothetical protein
LNLFCVCPVECECQSFKCVQKSGASGSNRPSHRYFRGVWSVGRRGGNNTSREHTDDEKKKEKTCILPDGPYPSFAPSQAKSCVNLSLWLTIHLSTPPHHHTTDTPVQFCFVSYRVSLPEHCRSDFFFFFFLLLCFRFRFRFVSFSRTTLRWLQAKLWKIRPYP